MQKEGCTSRKRVSAIEIKLTHSMAERIERAARDRGISVREFANQAVEIVLADHFSVNDPASRPVMSLLGSSLDGI